MASPGQLHASWSRRALRQHVLLDRWDLGGLIITSLKWIVRGPVRNVRQKIEKELARIVRRVAKLRVEKIHSLFNRDSGQS